MPDSVWSRVLAFLTVLGAAVTILSWLRPPARLALCVVLGAIAIQSVPVYWLYLCSVARHRRRLLASIESQGGRIAARLAADPRVILELDLSHLDLSALAWDSLHSLSELESLNLAHSSLADGHLDELCRLPALRHLDLKGTGITDQGLAALGNLPRLEFVSLLDTRITEDGLEQLAYTRPGLYVEANSHSTPDPLEPDKDAAYDARV